MKQDKPMYFGNAINDQYLTSLVSELTDLIKDLNVVDILKRFPQTQAVTKMMTIEKLKQIMPEVAQRYDHSLPITVRLNPSGLMEQEEVQAFLNKFNKVTYKKDALEILLAIAMELQVKKEDGQWEAFRAGFFSFGISGSLVQKSNSTSQYIHFSKFNIGIRKITLDDPTVDDPEERRKEDEGGAIMGLVNLLIKQKIPKEYYLELPTTYLPEINPSAVKISIQPGFLTTGYYEFEPDVYKDLRYVFMPDLDPRRVISAITQGMDNAELKRKGILPCEDCPEFKSKKTVEGGETVD